MRRCYRGNIYFIVTGASPAEMDHLTQPRPWVPHRIGVDGTYYLRCPGRLSETQRLLEEMGFEFIAPSSTTA